MKTPNRNRSVHLSEELHRRAKLEAVKRGIKLGELVAEAVSSALSRKPKQQSQEAA